MVDTSVVKLRTWVYNPFGKSKRPPQPIIGLPDNLWGSGKIFSSILRHINYPYGFIGVDLRGRGGSQMYPEYAQDMSQFALDKHVDDYLHILDHYHLNRAYVVAHGYGAYIAYSVAQRHPEKIGGIVLVDSGFPKVVSVDDPAYERHGFGVLATKHVEGEFSSPGEVISASGLPPKKPTELSVDEMAFLREMLHKTSNGKLAVKSNKLAAETEFNELSANLPTTEQLWKIRHPMALVTANKNGVISEGDAKIMKEILNLESSTNVDAEHHNALLLYPQHAKHIAEQLDHLTSTYDHHQRVTRMIDNVKSQIQQEQMEE